MSDPCYPARIVRAIRLHLQPPSRHAVRAAQYTVQITLYIYLTFRDLYFSFYVCLWPEAIVLMYLQKRKPGVAE
ncbi:hypothetical protein MPLDJ20_120204 [Mesorhizobium plurifarium]|uniref:Uncharacterized protein n=1 Tax=Mesorhizobium plurifarium TaxID=69974 RepID=A0A090EB29_MESPL|nr:hypothetical protein MPLDJ20_120204 [Mesorhizobium plurifarium]